MSTNPPTSHGLNTGDGATASGRPIAGLLSTAASVPGNGPDRSRTSTSLVRSTPAASTFGVVAPDALVAAALPGTGAASTSRAANTVPMAAADVTPRRAGPRQTSANHQPRRQGVPDRLDAYMF